MTALLDLASIVLVLAGAGFFLAGTAGLLRFPDLHTRLHALAKADNLGLGLIVLGLLPQAGGWAAAGTLVAVWAFALIAAAKTTQLIARYALDERPGEGKDRGA